ncbi:type II toxin-antitoxin system RelE/ParE family toxin [Rugamonas rubra]|jgi:plasmid maintenance system killer protein|uniref:Proteic killer suppression protein n=1 Tax=Rugamonas rubra TaxID=758825 RepID=A0A1I4HH80_9BURK|nr:type II toxin-antitoxin system RelE/ParE family toxin [Rugamonas rubra]SFL41658.1 proteic killer suppression protein [Rugamonas rubra]
MTIKNPHKAFLHPGLRRFWLSGAQDLSGISPTWAKALRLALVHLDSAKSLVDIQAAYGRIKNVKLLAGHNRRYAMEINSNWRLTFNCDDPSSGEVTLLDIEDLHRRGGAKRH